MSNERRVRVLREALQYIAMLERPDCELLGAMAARQAARDALKVDDVLRNSAAEEGAGGGGGDEGQQQQVRKDDQV